MKKIVLSIFLCVMVAVVRGQTASVEKSVFGIQTGLFGTWVHNELKISNQIILRSEIGIDISTGKQDFYLDVNFLLDAVVTLEPRWYYNLNKREKLSKRIDGNSGNFFSIKTSYHPDLLVISDSDESLDVVTDISIIPTWGIKRDIGDNFNYEAGLGAGYIYYFSERAGFLENEGELAINLHLRIGYRF